MKKYERQHIKEKFVTNEGYTAEIIDGGNKPMYCTVRIKDSVVEVSYGSLKKGIVKYPYHPSVYGVGYFGVGEYKAKENGKTTKAYIVWKDMLTRCYGEKYQSRQPTYIGCSVASEWHNFQTFAEWFEKHYVEGFHLDKDLLVPSNKTYSPETCIFIPPRLNSFLANHCSNNTSGVTGVCWYKKSKKWKVNISSEGKQTYLGLFDDPKEAAEAYKKARSIEASKLKELYRDVLPEKAIRNIR